MVARGRFELPSMGLFLVRESKAHHWPGHCFRPLLVHYTTGLQETRVSGQVPISLLRQSNQQFVSTLELLALAVRQSDFQVELQAAGTFPQSLNKKQAVLFSGPGWN